jgi:MFS family permease
VKTAFRSLKGYNYRVWAGGALVSNIGTWMQRTAQDWIVLTQLTHHNATSVGIVTALQFGPQLVLLPLTGYAADHMDRRKLLIATQAAMGVLALGLGLLTLFGAVTLWEVYGFALLLGCVTAFDSPARQTFVSDLVPASDIANAVALNSTSFNAARLIGPAVAGLLIGGIGSGWVFVLNAASFAFVIASLSLLRRDQLHMRDRPKPARGRLADGFRYVLKRPDLMAIMLMNLLIGMFALNFAIFISTMSVSVFHVGAERFGLLTSITAVGSVAGALMAAGRDKPRIVLLVAGAAMLGVGFILAAVMPNYWLFGGVLVLIGVATQTFTTTSVGAMQMSTDPEMRGRVMAILMAIALGGMPIGSPIVGWVADTYGPRWAMGVGGAAAVIATLIGLRFLIKHHGLRLHTDDGRLRLALDEPSS